MLEGEVDGEAGYVLAHTDFATYDISADGEITINGQVREPPRPLAGVNGYRVLVVDRRTLKKDWDRVYDTHDKLLAQIAMERDLTEVADNRKDTAIVFLATLGNPVNSKALPPPLPYVKGCTLDKRPFQETCRYDATGAEQKFSVPATTIDDVHAPLEVTLVGAHGGGVPTNVVRGGTGGQGAVVTGTLPVTDSGAGQSARAGSTLYVHVGKEGGDGGQLYGGDGGYNGGGDGGDSADIVDRGFPGGGGGGATDLSRRSEGQGQTYDSRLAVAAGGGGAGGSSTRDHHPATRGGDGGTAGWPAGAGGAGGSPSGHNGGGGATQSGGGSGGAVHGHDGTFDDAGAGAVADSHDYLASAGAGGGGGGGYYGGGGGGHADTSTPGFVGGGGGGGGSDLVPEGGRSAVVGASASVRPSASITFLTPSGPTLGDVLRRFGGTPTLIQSISASSPHYALVGAAGASSDVEEENPFAAPEASPAMTANATGDLQGVLERGNVNMWFQPVTSDSTAAVNFGLYDLLAGRVSGDCGTKLTCVAPLEPFPFEEDGTPQHAALRVISKQLCAECNDIRSKYGSDVVETSYVNKIKTLTPPTQPVGYTAAQYEEVRAQLELELSAASTLYGQQQNINGVLSAVAAAVDHEGPDVIAAVEQASSGGGGGGDLGVGKFLLEILEAVAGSSGLESLAAVFGTIAATLTLTGEVTDERESGKTWKEIAERIVNHTRESLDRAADRQAQLFRLVYSNWGMLDAYSENVTGGADGWDVSPAPQQRGLLSRLNHATTLALYRQIVPLRFDAAEGLAPTADLTGMTALKFHLKGLPIDKDTHDPCGDFDQGALYRYATNPPGGADPQETEFLVVTPSGDTTSISTELMAKMKKEGLFKPYLYLRWPLPRPRLVFVTGTCGPF